ncbi:MAG: acyl-CoA dehydratase activase [Candidatus Hodarchaeota archaeon]
MKFVLGIDIGSLTAKAVVLDLNSKILGSKILPVGADPLRTTTILFDELIAKLSLTKADMTYCLSTGYGRKIAMKIFLPKDNIEQMTEISCHARGAYFLNSQIKTVIDIGGQDSKAIALNEEGFVRDFEMNDKCSAGTGRFLEVMAKALETSVEEMGELALQSENPVSISSTCTVFAESEVISHVAQGKDRIDILAGIHQSVATKVAGLAKRLPNIESEIMLTGGVAKNPAVKKSLEEELGYKLVLPPNPQIVGALGAALYALQKSKKRS